MSLILLKSNLTELTKLKLVAAVVMGFISSSFVVMLNYFAQTVDVNSFLDVLPNIIIVVLFWLILSILALRKIGIDLNNQGFSDLAFFVMYLLIIAPIEQLTFNIYKFYNNGMVDSFIFILIILLENLILVPIIINLINIDKFNEKARKSILIGALMFCLLISVLVKFVEF